MVSALFVLAKESVKHFSRKDEIPDFPGMEKRGLDANRALTCFVVSLDYDFGCPDFSGAEFRFLKTE